MDKTESFLSRQIKRSRVGKLGPSHFALLCSQTQHRIRYLLPTTRDQTYNEVYMQRAKKVLSDSPGLADFATGLVNSVINLPDGQVNFFEEFKLQKNCEISLLIKTFFGLVEMIFGLVNVSFSLPEWQAVKMTFLAP